MNELSKAQINKLGERLKKDEVSEEDLRLLAQFRESFVPSYQEVVDRITTELGLTSTGRLAKSIESISDKLRRQSIKLSRIQDIAGCRIIVKDVHAQEQAVAAISNLFDDVKVVDRRVRPSNGYRAVHLIVRSTPRIVEVQIRTTLQHLWAENSEKLSDKWGHGLKYGVGDQAVLEILAGTSMLVKRYENREKGEFELRATLTRLEDKANLNFESADLVKRLRNMLAIREGRNEQYRADVFKALQDAADL
jgi:hypothetical protein